MESFLIPLENQELETPEQRFPKKVRKNEIKIELDETKEWGKKNKQKDLTYSENKYKYEFQQYEAIRFFDESIYSGKITIDEAKAIY